MHQAIARSRAKLNREPDRDDPLCDDAVACSSDTMRRTYEVQWERGVPEAVRGLKMIEQGRWPSSR
jgi:hypothetical protein